MALVRRALRHLDGSSSYVLSANKKARTFLGVRAFLQALLSLRLKRARPFAEGGAARTERGQIVWNRAEHCGMDICKRKIPT